MSMRDVLAAFYFPLVLAPGVLALLGLLFTGHIGAHEWIPLLLLLMYTGIFGASVASGMREAERSHRRRRGACETCGYDLRAHAKGERCPECGTEVARDT